MYFPPSSIKLVIYTVQRHVFLEICNCVLATYEISLTVIIHIITQLAITHGLNRVKYRLLHTRVP